MSIDLSPVESAVFGVIALVCVKLIIIQMQMARRVCSDAAQWENVTESPSAITRREAPPTIMCVSLILLALTVIAQAGAGGACYGLFKWTTMPLTAWLTAFGLQIVRFNKVRSAVRRGYNVRRMDELKAEAMTKLLYAVTSVWHFFAFTAGEGLRRHAATKMFTCSMGLAEMYLSVTLVLVYLIATTAATFQVRAYTGGDYETRAAAYTARVSATWLPTAIIFYYLVSLGAQRAANIIALFVHPLLVLGTVVAWLMPYTLRYLSIYGLRRAGHEIIAAEDDDRDSVDDNTYRAAEM